MHAIVHQAFLAETGIRIARNPRLLWERYAARLNDMVTATMGDGGANSAFCRQSLQTAKFNTTPPKLKTEDSKGS